MTYRYRIGQKVEVLAGRYSEGAIQYIGLVGVIVSRETHPFQRLGDYYAAAGNYYLLEGCPDYLFIEANLKPINDGDNVSNWSECAWRPNLEHPLLPAPQPEKETA